MILPWKTKTVSMFKTILQLTFLCDVLVNVIQYYSPEANTT